MAELTTLARPYAKAAFEYARAAGQLQLWSEGLALVATVSQEETVSKLLNAPGLTSQAKLAELLAICGEDIDAKVKNFVSVLADNKRLELLADVSALFEHLKAQQEKSVDVDVITAFELADAQQQQLAKALSTKLDREVNLVNSIDKSILGGALVRAGDTVIDGSVRGRLVKLAEAMNA